MHQFKSKKILISDVPPRITQTTNQGIVVARIGGLCAAVTMAAALFLFFGAWSRPLPLKAPQLPAKRSPGSVSCNLPLFDRMSSLQLNSRRRTLLDQTTRAANLEYDNSRHQIRWIRKTLPAIACRIFTKATAKKR